MAEQFDDILDELRTPRGGELPIDLVDPDMAAFVVASLMRDALGGRKVEQMCRNVRAHLLRGGRHVEVSRVSDGYMSHCVAHDDNLTIYGGSNDSNSSTGGLVLHYGKSVTMTRVRPQSTCEDPFRRVFRRQGITVNTGEYMDAPSILFVETTDTTAHCDEDRGLRRTGKLHVYDPLSHGIPQLEGIDFTASFKLDGETQFPPNFGHRVLSMRGNFGRFADAFDLSGECDSVRVEVLLFVEKTLKSAEKAAEHRGLKELQ